MSAITSAAAASAGIASTQRDFIRVDLSDFETRKEEIVKTIMEASTNQGFFYGKITTVNIFAYYIF
jgi:precorrin-3B methylase